MTGRDDRRPRRSRVARGCCGTSPRSDLAMPSGCRATISSHRKGAIPSFKGFGQWSEISIRPDLGPIFDHSGFLIISCKLFDTNR